MEPLYRKIKTRNKLMFKDRSTEARGLPDGSESFVNQPNFTRRTDRLLPTDVPLAFDVLSTNNKPPPAQEYYVYATSFGESYDPEMTSQKDMMPQSLRLRASRQRDEQTAKFVRAIVVMATASWRQDTRINRPPI